MNLLAEVTGADLTQPLLNAGFMGAALIWMATRAESRMKSMEAASNRTARAILVLVISLRGANDAARAEAKVIMNEIDASDKSRTGEQ